jgi:hypothetical protein
LQTVLGNLPGATALAIDNVNGRMYWSETGATNRIRRANLDGSNVETVLNTPGEVYDLALDVAANLMVFGQNSALVPESLQVIRAATLDGGSPHDLVSGSGFTPYAVGLFGGRVYFPGEGGGSIRRVNYDGTQNELYLEPAGGGTFALVRAALNGRVYWLDEDDDWIRAEAGHYELFNLKSVTAVDDPQPWGFVADGERLYWTDTVLARVQSVDLEGNGYEFFDVEGKPRRLALAVPEPGVVGVLLIGSLLGARRRRPRR